MTRTRVAALLCKEWLDLRRNLGALAPVVIVAVLALVLPMVIVFGIPAATGVALAADSDLAAVSRLAGGPGIVALSPNAQVQYFLLQQFLLLFLLTPITGAMALASHSVVGEKQARTLEPLLATPATTVELLVAKVLGAMWPSLGMALACLTVYAGGIVSLAEPGVAAAMANLRTALVVLFIAPAASLVALQAAIIVSSRVNDARTAQQVGVLIIVPLTALLIGQFVGWFWISDWMLVLIGLGLITCWLLLVVLSARLFGREAILTRWR